MAGKNFSREAMSILSSATRRAADGHQDGIPMDAADGHQAAVHQDGIPMNAADGHQDGQPVEPAPGTGAFQAVQVKENRKTRRVQLLLTPDVYDAIKGAADTAGISVNEWANQVFRYITGIQ